MARPLTRDLTTGPIGGHFRTLAVPAAIGMRFDTLCNVVDMFFAGVLSTRAQAIAPCQSGGLWSVAAMPPA